MNLPDRLAPFLPVRLFAFARRRVTLRLVRRLLAFLPFVAALVFAGSALASPPVLSSVTVSADRHPSALFSAPRADDVEIYFASKPDQGTDGSFYDENVVTQDDLTNDEIQAGRWTYEDQLDPGTYYVMLHASPSFDACYVDSTGGYDPSCADGYSNIVKLRVPVPPIRYTASASVLRYIGEVNLNVKATPLGVDQAYRVCYLNAAKKKRCVSGTLDGYSWDASGTDELTVSTKSLAPTTTFTWYVGSRAVATKRVKTPHS